MNNIVAYAENNLKTFDQKHFNSVDSLILSWMSYLHIPGCYKDAHNWTGIRFQELFRAEHFPVLFQGIWDPKSSQQLVTAMAASPRYRDMLVSGFTEQTDIKAEKQFAAVTFQLTDNLCYIAFRGTDSSLIGWKEDFNMAFQYPIPSQESARQYLAEAAEHYSAKFNVGGHSKGGNLAVYAAANSSESVGRQIDRVFSHDGPGFLESALSTTPFLSLTPKLDKTLPQSSLVGMLLEQQENFRIVKSNRISFWQHDPFSWLVEDNDFCYVNTLTPDARYLNQTLNGWIRKLSDSEREQFVDALFSLIDTENAQTWADVFSDRQKKLPAAIHNLSQMDEKTRSVLLQAAKELLSLGVKCFPELLNLRPPA